MKAFIFKAILRLVAILLPIGIFRLGIEKILDANSIGYQILYAVIFLVITMALALFINWIANRIPYNGFKKGK